MRNALRVILWVLVAFIFVTAGHIAGPTRLAAQAGVAVDKASIGGTVTNASTGKPEAGVWVIAETKLGVPYRKIVTTQQEAAKIYMLDPKTQKYTDYLLPPPGRLAHGIDFSTDGNVWFSAGSGHLGRIDRKTGKFTYWELPGAKFFGTGNETGSTEYPYFMWVDQFDTLGMGKNTVIVTGTTSDSMLVFNPKTEKWTVFRLPYPLPFYTRGLDGRIDNPNAGWKGRGIWTSYNSYLPKFTETKLGYVNHIQYRPSPLAN